MHKSLIVASTEFANSVRTKAFIISMVLVPVLAVGTGLAQKMMMDRVDTSAHRFAIVDETGRLGTALERAAVRWNASAADQNGRLTGPTFVPVLVTPGTITDEQRLRLSEQVKSEALFAFVEIPAGVFATDQPVRFRYYSNHPTYNSLPNWLRTAVTSAVVNERFAQASVDRATVEKLTRPVSMDQMGLVQRGADGGLKPAQEVNKLRLALLPVVLMFLVFMPVMTITPQLMNTVLEEKMSRVSEVLLGSVTPFELMLGKMLGAGGVTVVIGLTYTAGAYAAAVYFGYTSMVSAALLVEVAVFLAMALLLYGSLYLAIGAACSTFKDAQSLMMPVMLVCILPMMMLGPIVQAPDGPFAVAASFFPFSTPYIMLMRAALDPPAPLWQVLLSIVTTGVTTVGVVWASGRIFRTGLLMHGKAPSFADLAKWVKA
jgi:ABC-2 type transport system permease protein